MVRNDKAIIVLNDRFTSKFLNRFVLLKDLFDFKLDENKKIYGPIVVKISFAGKCHTTKHYGLKVHRFCLTD
jgi:hypothetical protein